MADPLLLYQPTDESVVIYRTEDNTLQLDVQLADETVWLTQQQMAELFQSSRTNIVEHIKHIYKDKELDEISTCRKFRQVQKEGTRMVTRQLPCYNLDMIISVGYRVNSIRGIQFRRWANRVLKDYLMRGYAVNQQLIHLEQRVEGHLEAQEKRLAAVEEKVDFFVRTNQVPIEQVFFNGDFFAARVILEQLIKTARKRIVIIDAYVDAATFQILDVRASEVTAEIISGKDLTSLREAHNATVGIPPIQTTIWATPSHDRWLIIDDQLYHCGHSLNDLGRKLSAISLMGINPETILHTVRTSVAAQ